MKCFDCGDLRRSDPRPHSSGRKRRPKVLHAGI
jgi:hypothetical protein